ncbi:hypothetical protein GQ472_01695 [archaeon]|nr:hypothetical protein [archaeon]
MTRFITKGRGTGRKVIPIKDRNKAVKFSMDDDELERPSFKDRYLRSLRDDAKTMTTSDLQGVVGAKVHSLADEQGIVLKVPLQAELEDIMLQYAYGEMDINSAQRFMTDIIMKADKIPIQSGDDRANYVSEDGLF